MLFEEIKEATQVWSRAGGKQVRKYRCQSGIRKGRVMSSPAACNKPLDVKRSVNLKKTKMTKGGRIQMTGTRTRKTNVASKRLKKLNVPRRKSAGRGGRL